MSRNFNIWLDSFRDSIASYGYYIDFEKVHRNVDGIKVELNILNSLIGSKDIKRDFEKIRGTHTAGSVRKRLVSCFFIGKIWFYRYRTFH